MMPVEKRIEKLERANRWMRIALVVLVVGLACTVLMAATGAPGDLKAQSLSIMQPNGKTGLLLKATDDGGAIYVYGASRTTGPMMSIFAIPQSNGGGAQIFMHGSKGQNAVNIVAQKKGNVRTW